VFIERLVTFLPRASLIFRGFYVICAVISITTESFVNVIIIIFNVKAFSGKICNEVNQGFLEGVFDRNQMQLHAFS